MKSILLLWIVLGSAAFAQSTNVVSDSDMPPHWGELRHKAIEQIRTKLADPNTTQKEKAELADFALTLLDSDTKVFDGSLKDLNKQLAHIEATQDAQDVPQTNAPAIPQQPPDPAAVVEPTPGDISVVEKDAKVTSEDEGFDTVAWKTVLKNNSSDAKTVSVIFTFLDASDFEIQHDSKLDVSIAAGATVSVTGQDMLRSEDWTKAAKYSVALQ